MPDWKLIQAEIKAQTGELIDIRQLRPLGGGCINQAFVIGAPDANRYVVKLNQVGLVDMFAAEFDGLNELARTRTITVPTPVSYGLAGDASYLAMRHIRFGSARANSPALFGEKLAAMHQSTSNQFGWHRDNTIGATPQVNRYCDHWVEFWTSQRLQFQLDLAEKNHAPAKLIEAGAELANSLELFFSDYSPEASCLHGDLWSGNWAYDDSGQPVIFDPAVYFGDRETDIAMTELFGSAGSEFYAAYNHATPLDRGYSVRRTLYNLYHILNHFNLFSGGYATQAEQMTQQLLSEIR